MELSAVRQTAGGAFSRRADSGADCEHCSSWAWRGWTQLGWSHARTCAPATAHGARPSMVHRPRLCSAILPSRYTRRVPDGDMHASSQASRSRCQLWPATAEPDQQRRAEAAQGERPRDARGRNDRTMERPVMREADVRRRGAICLTELKRCVARPPCRASPPLTRYCPSHAPFVVASRRSDAAPVGTRWTPDGHRDALGGRDCGSVGGGSGGTGRPSD